MIDGPVLQFPEFCSQLKRKTFILSVLALQNNWSSSFQHSSELLKQAQALYGAETIKVRRKNKLTLKFCVFPKTRKKGESQFLTSKCDHILEYCVVFQNIISRCLLWFPGTKFTMSSQHQEYLRNLPFVFRHPNALIRTCPEEREQKI